MKGRHRATRYSRRVSDLQAELAHEQRPVVVAQPMPPATAQMLADSYAHTAGRSA
ncbi:hypothetical protein VC74_gp74 [Mycobacterium phage Sparky]|uniref:Uncharacterized protein n=1 Tax=Mycobacterium phage Sparky TaxID=1527493 RepID=A0A076G7U8_9CAUD|nr:hypothetical protein VC74_gp74 [Mycobacterium phage Sparky]AII28196.1 hypothetical protein PBI_SPARKY_52 [Mycobacterium phage Sparky]